MDPAGVFGAAKAGLPFDPLTFFKKPQVILRLVSLLFSIIVFGCISSGGWYLDVCIYNKDGNACNYGVAVGVIAFLAAILLLVSDALFDSISNVKQRKYIVIADMGFCSFWTFLWFVGFCYLTNKWNSATPNPKMFPPWMQSNAQGAIAFCFLSIPIWAGLTFFAVQRFRLGLQGAFGPSDQIERQVGGVGEGGVGGGGMEAGGAAPYSAYPGVDSTGGDLAGGGGAYRQQPFSGGAAQPQYGQPMTY